MKLFKKISIYLLVLTTAFSFSIYFIHAAEDCPGEESDAPCSEGVSFELKNPFKGGDTLFELLETIIEDILLPIGGVVAVIAFIYVGFKFVLAAGNDNKIKEAKAALMYVAIGTALLLGAWVIANVIKNTVEQLM